MKRTIIALLILAPAMAVAAGNTENTSFNKAKKTLERHVYHDNTRTLYCGAMFEGTSIVKIPPGFETHKYVKRAERLEWEHVVPAENFGKTFSEYRDGHSQCVDSKGNAFKGRRCVEKMNTEYRYMQADMYNLFPAIGTVNAQRLNYNFVAQVDSPNTFGSCPMKIKNRKVEPPEAARGQIARTYLYMDQTYKRYSMSRSQSQLMIAWDKMYPVTKWECVRYFRIKQLQKNENTIMAARCPN